MLLPPLSGSNHVSPIWVDVWEAMVGASEASGTVAARIDVTTELDDSPMMLEAVMRK